MANKGRKVETVFFVYDHSMLKKEEDDLKDAILYFYPEDVSADDQCVLCGQLMGMAEFLTDTISKSAPTVFKFDRQKFAVKKSGAYSLVLQGGSFDPDSIILNQLHSMYDTFVTFHGTIDSLKLRCKETPGAFVTELANIWRTILELSLIQHNHTQTFLSLPYVRLPKTGSHLFLQASHLLQSSQRRPDVLAGAILYKNGVLSTQLSPTLTRHLTCLQNKMPHITQKTDFDLPRGCKIVTVFLTDEELAEMYPGVDQPSRHCQNSDFTAHEDRCQPVISQSSVTEKKHKTLQRRRTCPNLNPATSSHGQNVSQKALQSFLTNERRKMFDQRQEPHLRNLRQPLLSNLTIVECRSRETMPESDSDMGSLYETAQQKHFSETCTQIMTSASCENEAEESDSEPETGSKDVSIPRDPGDRANLEVKSVIEIEGQDIKRTEFDIEQNHIAEKPVTEGADPSISDLENEEPDNSESVPLNRSSKKNVLIHEAILTSTLEKHNFVNDKVPKAENSFIENSQECHTSTSMSFQSEKGTEKLEESITSDKTAPSVSSEDDKKSRFYDSLTDDQTDTLFKKSNYSVHNHRVDVHVEHETGNGKNPDTDSVGCGDNVIDTNTDSDNKGIAIKDDTKVKDQKDTYGANIDSVESRKNLEVEGEQTENSSSYCFNNDETHLNASGTVKTASTLKSEQVISKKSVICANGLLDTTRVLKETTDIVQRENYVHSDKVAKNEICTKEEVQDSNRNDKRDSVKELTESESEGFVEPRIRQSGTDSEGKESESEVNVTDGDSEKENKNPNLVKVRKRLSSELSKYESEIETEDEGLYLANTEPCINCLDLESKLTEEKRTSATTVRCVECIEKFKKYGMFGGKKENQEVIDFGDEDRVRDPSGVDTDGGLNTSSEELSYLRLTNATSIDSSISKYWTKAIDGLNDLTLYVQCHSDISLMLLLDTSEQCDESLLYSLWKGSLAHLADLDFYIKECMDSSDEEEEMRNRDNHRYLYLRFNSFSADLRGTVKESYADKKAVNQAQMLACLHSEFQHDHCLSDITLRSHWNSCYAHSNQVDETYFIPDTQLKLMSGFPLYKDPVYNMDTSVKKLLARDRRLSLL